MNLKDCDELLNTTRSVRKRLDFARPVDEKLLRDCIDIAIQSPSGSNLQGWHFLLVSDPEKKKALADLYRRAFGMYTNMPAPEYSEGDPRGEQQSRVVSSATYLAENLERAPWYLIPCLNGRFEEGPQFMQASQYGSILPAVWSFMLAARARGVGSAWTTLHLMFEKEAGEILGVPENVTQVALLPVAYFRGKTFKLARRVPAREVTYVDSWGNKG